MINEGRSGPSSLIMDISRPSHLTLSLIPVLMMEVSRR